MNQAEDDDGPYQTFVVASFVTSLISLGPVLFHLRQQCELYGRTPAALFYHEEMARRRLKQMEADQDGDPGALLENRALPMMLFGPDQ